MNPILTIFLVIVIFLMTQRLLNWLAKHLPNMAFNLTIYVVSLFASVNDEPLPSSEQEEVPQYKTLRRWQTGSLRHRLAEYITHLESGKSGRVTQALWKAYIQWIPEHYRTVESESAMHDPLPLWLEQLIQQLQKRHIRLSLLILAFFILLVLSAHLWLPYLGLFASGGDGTLKSQIHLILGQEIQDCANASLSSTEYCFLDSRHYLFGDHQDTLVEHTLRTIGHQISNPPTQSNNHLSLLVDAKHSIYYPVLSPISLTSGNSLSNFLFSSDTKAEDYEWRTKYLHTEGELSDLLVRIQLEETKRGIVNERPCLCPFFLHLSANVSFYLDTVEQRWLVMAQPVIYRNNSFAELVSSSVNLNSHSLFKHNQRQETPHEMIHYDSFVIEYTDLSSNQLLLEDDTERVLTQLELFNAKLKEADYEEARIYYRPNKESVQAQRKKMHVSGDDAICFIYCSTVEENTLLS